MIGWDPRLANGPREIMTNAAMHVGYSPTPKRKRRCASWLPLAALETHVVRGQSRGNAGTTVNELPNEHDTIPSLGRVETVMEASLCPMCSRALKISMVEPHPTRDGVDVVTRRCPIHGDIWRSVVVNELRQQIPDIATLLLRPRREQARFVRSRQNRATKHEPGRAKAAVSIRKSRDLVLRVVDVPDRIWSGSNSLYSRTPSGCGVLGPASGLTPGAGPPPAGPPGAILRES